MIFDAQKAQNYLMLDPAQWEDIAPLLPTCTLPGDAVRYRKDALDAWMEQIETTPPANPLTHPDGPAVFFKDA